MTDAEMTRTPGTGGRQDFATAAPMEDELAAVAGTEADASPAETGRSDGERGAQLLDSSERESLAARWREIQAEFVDEPRGAVADAGALVAELIERLSRMFATELDQLESRWSSGQVASTEDLRQGLRRYRALAERLLSV